MFFTVTFGEFNAAFLNKSIKFS